MSREPLTEEQQRLAAVAYPVHPKQVIPNSEEDWRIGDELCERGLLDQVRERKRGTEPDDSDEVVGYVASEKLVRRMDARSGMN
jgi:hypothetical protein